MSTGLRIALWTIVVLVLLFGATYLPRPDGPNLGLPVGYYGKFNQVKAEIERMPDVEIVDVALHRDLTLEEFWITVRTKGGELVELEFIDANIRSVDDLKSELEVLSAD